MSHSTTRHFMGTLSPLDEVTQEEEVQRFQSSPEGSPVFESSPLSFSGCIEGNAFPEINDNGIFTMMPYSLDNDVFPSQPPANNAPSTFNMGASPKEDNDDNDEINAPTQSHVLEQFDIPDGMPVYNYQRNEQDRLDSSTLLTIKIALSKEARDGLKRYRKDNLHSVVRGKLLRFDGAQIPLYDKETKEIRMLQVPDDIFSYDLENGSDILTVQIHRKYLPISKNFGEIAFRFAFYISVTQEVVSTNSFDILSKEPSEQEKLKAQQKKQPIRKRGPSPKEPRAGIAGREDNFVSEYIQNTYRQTVERVAHVGRKRSRDECECVVGQEGRKSVAGDSVTTEETLFEEETGSILDYA